MANRSVFTAFGAAAIGTSTRYILVDLDDASWPHEAPNLKALADCQVRVKRTWGWLSTATGGDPVLKIGVVDRVDATNGDIKWFVINDITPGATIGAYMSFDQSFGTGFCPKHARFSPGNDDAKTTTFSKDDTAWKTGNTFANGFDAAKAVAAGDIVIELIESAGTHAFCVFIEYDVI